MLPASSLTGGGRRGRRPDGTRTETELVQMILAYLAARRILAWRQNTGGAWFPGKAKAQYVKFGPTGSPDISGVLRELGGRALFIEVKRPGEDLSPAQVHRLTLLRDWGALAFRAESLVDVECELIQAGFPMS